ncbi:hypothetical protein NUU61_002117 [Penicillium alfredii]|uniref:beta-glucosidase n=1 Tax=Penicillium alfredii TaxID=1506179 RepID=A0A9W9FQZ7_9EURO|nr:uncharacterized protein NUU61_002117 [Penicillium alfredii]KAJ5104770.1 hypothetical protein NUU61_002117 [Penicillium alfredii]
MKSVTKQLLTAGTDVEMGATSRKSRRWSNQESSILQPPTLRFLDCFASSLRWVSLRIRTLPLSWLARELDREPIVLMENHNGTLPLNKSGNIAVIGPMAHGFMNMSGLYGGYVVYKSQCRGATLDGIKAAVGNKAQVHYAQGRERWSNDQLGFDEVIDAAKKPDVAVVVVGTLLRDQMELWQGNWRARRRQCPLSLVGAQGPLIKAIVDTGVPTVVVLSNGKPITDTWLSNTTSALVRQFYLSERGGNALADVLFGDYNPSGKLSVSFPSYVGDLPVFYDYLNSARSIGDSGHEASNGTLVFGHQYVLGNPTPWYPFGYGKSYSNFKYGAVWVDRSTVSASDRTVTVSVNVTNTHTHTKRVTVYISDDIASVVVPNRQLKGFEKVVIPVKIAHLGVWNARMKYVVEPGRFTVLVGSSSEDIRGNTTFTVR